MGNAMKERARLPDGSFASEHGGRRTKLYGVWCSMKERCSNPHNKSYPRYGGRGITVCTDWANDFSSFRDWAYAAGFRDGLTIDRIDGNKGYSPENCRWATTAQQNRNYSRNHMITYNGETKCLSDWADQFGIKRGTVLFRIQQGKPLPEVFNPIDGRTTRWQKTTL